jgi:long-chain acyl-CoA synthetase
MAPYKIPSLIEFRESLPTTMVGKVLRRVLKEEEISKREKEHPSAAKVEDVADPRRQG